MSVRARPIEAALFNGVLEGRQIMAEDESKPRGLTREDKEWIIGVIADALGWNLFSMFNDNQFRRQQMEKLR